MDSISATDCVRQTQGTAWRVQKKILERKNFVCNTKDFKWGKNGLFNKQYFETTSYLLELDLYLGFCKNSF